MLQRARESGARSALSSLEALHARRMPGGMWLAGRGGGGGPPVPPAPVPSDPSGGEL